MATVRVAALPIAETGALWAAMEEGIFEDHGLKIEVVPAQGGANAIPALSAATSSSRSASRSARSAPTSRTSAS